MHRYQRRVCDVLAVKFTGETWVQAMAFTGHRLHTAAEGQLVLDTPSGPVPIHEGDWIAQNPTDPTDFYPIKDDQFDKLYHPDPIDVPSNPEPRPRRSVSHNWNIEDVPGTNRIRLCRGGHERYMSCEWEEYEPVRDEPRA